MSKEQDNKATSGGHGFWYWKGVRWVRLLTHGGAGVRV